MSLTSPAFVVVKTASTIMISLLNPKTSHPNCRRAAKRVKKNPSSPTNFHLNIVSRKKEMLSIMNNCGLPVCLSGIYHPLALSKEMADHERRREEMKKMWFQENMERYEEMSRAHEREALGDEADTDEDDAKDGTVIIHEFSCITLACTAKAA